MSLKSSSQSSLFHIDIPVKKSIVIDDAGRKSSGNFPLSQRSNTLQSQPEYVRYNFLIKKLRRITYALMRQVLRQVRFSRYDKFCLGLLNNKSKRTLAQAFFTILRYTHTFKEKNLTNRITKNKKPDLLVLAIKKAVINYQGEIFKQIRECAKRYRTIEQFARLIGDLAEGNNIKLLKPFGLQQIKAKASEFDRRIQCVKKLFKAFPKIQRRYKIMVFARIVKHIQLKELEAAVVAKADMNKKWNETAGDKNKLLMAVKESFRETKYLLDHESAKKNKTIYEIRRDAGTLKGKFKEEAKKLNKEIQDLKKQKNLTSEQLGRLNLINQKRAGAIKSSKGMKAQASKLYQKIYKERETQGNIKALPKQVLSQVVKIQKEEQYHLYLNQKLRQEVTLYERGTSLYEKWPQEEIVMTENIYLKEMISLLVAQELDNVCNQGILEDI